MMIRFWASRLIALCRWSHQIQPDLKSQSRTGISFPSIEYLSLWIESCQLCWHSIDPTIDRHIYQVGITVLRNIRRKRSTAGGGKQNKLFGRLLPKEPKRFSQTSKSTGVWYVIDQRIGRLTWNRQSRSGVLLVPWSPRCSGQISESEFVGVAMQGTPTTKQENH